jgi:hypothetical protein
VIGCAASLELCSLGEISLVTGKITGKSWENRGKQVLVAIFLVSLQVFVREFPKANNREIFHLEQGAVTGLSGS